MQFKIIASSVDAGAPVPAAPQYAATYVINANVAIDAGVLGYMPLLAEQKQIMHVFLSHSHGDHVATLPIFLDNTYVPGPQCVTVYGLPETLDCLRKHVFNELVWPDLERLSREETPFVKLVPLAPGIPVDAAGLRVTPIALDHVVPTVGFLVDDGTASIAVVSDTLPTDAVWEATRKLPNLRAVFLESAFPNSYRWLADKAKHLTPELVRLEYAKLQRDVPLIVVHIKPAFRDQIVSELQALGIPQLRIGEPNVLYEF